METLQECQERWMHLSDTYLTPTRHLPDTYQTPNPTNHVSPMLLSATPCLAPTHRIAYHRAGRWTAVYGVMELPPVQILV